jgi:hypothetical protein
MKSLALALDVAVSLLLLHSLVNAALLRRPRPGGCVDEAVSILLPVRNEAHRVAPTLRSLLDQAGLRQAEILVYDDGSADATADVVRDVGGPRVRLLAGSALPPGWLGKPHACAQLAAAASGSVLVFVDADVVLDVDAIAAAVALLRQRGLQFVSPYPRQLTGSWLERLVQPLLWWSWLICLPLRVAERSSRPSLAAANGQFLVVDERAYRHAGGHAAVRSEVVEDVALARALVRSGAHGGFVDGSAIARCRMYDGARAVVDGYAKSAWCAFGSPVAAAVVATAFLVLAVLPWALVGITAWAWPAALGGPVSRLVAAARSGSRPVLDAFGHPLSALAFACIVAISLRRHGTGRLAWKSRALP